MSNAMNAYLGGVNGASDIAPTVVTQLKSDSNSGMLKPVEGYKMKGSFLKGFKKEAGIGNVLRSAVTGAKSTLNAPLKSALNPLAAYNELKSVHSAHKGLISAAKTEAGQKDLGAALGRALPSALATGAYAYTGKSLLDKVMRKREQVSPQDAYSYGAY